MRLKEPQIVFWGVAILIVVLAQIVRFITTNTIYNNQLAFSISWPMSWIVPTIILVLGVVIWWFYRTKPKTPAMSFSFGLIVGGGASNLFERITNAGLVADYWDMVGFFTFNLADVTIFTGIVGLMIYFLYVRA